MRLPACLYRQYDATAGAPVPASTYGGWRTVEVELDPSRTALVVMHAWDCGPPDAYPGWRRAVEYHGRAERILRDVFPPLLGAVRRSPLRVFHVVGGGRDYYRHLPGYRWTHDLAGASPPAPMAPADSAADELRRIRRRESFPGEHNLADIAAGFARLDFAAEARPLAVEGIAEDGAQLAALARRCGVSHLIYIGFALNWCLLMSPGGMVDLGRAGYLCSTIAEATTAVENRETAAEEREKQQALWRVALEFGFVFGLDDVLHALGQPAQALPIPLPRPDRGAVEAPDRG